MRTGLFGAVSKEGASVSGASLMAAGAWHCAFGLVVPAHRVQRAVLRRRSSTLYGLHGVWLNAPSEDWEGESHADVVLETVSSPSSFEHVEGPLHGCSWNEDTHALLLHADFARQHPLFWHLHPDGLLFAFSVDRLVELMKDNGLAVDPNPEGAAMLLTYGSILGDQTLVRGVHKLMPGCTLIWTPEGCRMEPRTALHQIPRDLRDEREAIEALDAAFNGSILAMVEANRQAQCVQHNLLSGGLDSRLVTLATSRVEPGASCLCFSAKGYLDHTLSERIANDFALGYRFHDLSEGQYMMETASVWEYDGCVNYLASAHHRAALTKAVLPKLGLLASGQGANVLLTDDHPWDATGEEVLAGFEMYDGVLMLAKQPALAAWQSCPNPQVFKVLHRGFLYTNSGAYSTADFGVLWSPFTSQAFVQTALRLTPELIRRQRVYLAWMAQRFPRALDYAWERYGVPPVQGWRLRLAQVWAKVHAKLGKMWPVLAPQSMSPIQSWFESSPEIQDFYRKTFRQHREWLALHPSVREAVERDYETMSVMNKASVLTLLLASKSWFEK
jgi:asparagine synthase (glutamine-hydrolysing)